MLKENKLKTKEFEIEVVTTKTVKVILPETYTNEELIKDWESGLWSIPEGVIDIAKYAAEMHSNFEGCSHDGVGDMIENSYTKPDYSKNPYQVVAYAIDEYVEVDVLKQGDWHETL